MNTRLLIFIVLFTITISGIGVDLYSPSLPWIAQFMKVHQSLAKYTITTFLIGFAIGQLVFGVLADIHGRKWVLSAGIFLFVLSSFIAVFSTDIYMLMIMRLIQGFSAAACSVIAKTILTDSLEGISLYKAMISLGIAWAVGPIIAPVIGGYLQHRFNWQANFYFYTIYSLVLLLTVLFFLKETLKSKVEPKLTTIKKHYGTLLKHRVFMTGTIVLGFGYSLIIAFNVMGPFLIQRTLHYSPVVFGHMALIVGFAFFLGNTLSRILVKHISLIAIVKIGLAMMLFFSVSYVVEPYYLPISLWTIVLPTSLILMSAGLIFPNCLSISMSLFPQIAGISSSLLGAMLYLIPTITSSIFGFVPLSTQQPYAWTLLLVLLALSGVLLFGFFPGVRRLPQK